MTSTTTQANSEGAGSTNAQLPSTPRQRPTTSSASESGWFTIPAPLARVFKKFPILTYPPNELPARSLQQIRDVATLYVFISDADALEGLPSFNPSCLKWQTFLKLAGVDLRLASSNNHASPNGALPFLIPGNEKSPSTAASIIPSNKLEQYALSHASSLKSVSDTPSSLNHKLDTYTALLDHKIRNAWLCALYLSPANTDLLRHLYIDPISTSSIVQKTTLFQLRAAAESEVTKSSTHNTLHAIYRSTNTNISINTTAQPAAELSQIYKSARDAFSALEKCLGKDTWFFGNQAPGVFDAAVFSYTHLILEYSQVVQGRPSWGDRTLVDIVSGFPKLVEHRTRIYQQCWESS